MTEKPFDRRSERAFQFRGSHRGGPDREALIRRRHMLVVALTFVTGCADAIGFFALGAFSSVMTGNMVLLGFSAGILDTSLLVISAIAIVAYGVGVICGARIAGSPEPTDSVWPRRVVWALTVELGLFIVFTIVWEVDEAVDGNPSWILLVLASAAMGIQGSAVQRFGVSGLSSTYLTGTLTTFLANLAARRPFRTVWPSGQVLLALIVGAAVGSVIYEYAPRLAPVALLVPLVSVVVLGAVLSAKAFRSAMPETPPTTAAE